MNPEERFKFPGTEKIKIDAEALLERADRERKEVIEKHTDTLQEIDTIRKNGGAVSFDEKTEGGRRAKDAVADLMQSQFNYSDAEDFKRLRDEGKTDQEIADYLRDKWMKDTEEMASEQDEK